MNNIERKKYSLDYLLERGADYNPRTISEKERSGIKESIKKFGYVQDVIFNVRTETVVSGHQRLPILQELGYSEIDVTTVDLPLEDEKKLNIIMNSQEITGEFTLALNSMLDEIAENDVEFFDKALLSDMYLKDDIEEEVEKEKIQAKQMLLPYESYDCILVVFKDEKDFNFATSKLGLNDKYIISSPSVENKKVGKTRAISGDVLVNAIRGEGGNEDGISL